VSQINLGKEQRCKFKVEHVLEAVCVLKNVEGLEIVFECRKVVSVLDFVDVFKHYEYSIYTIPYIFCLNNRKVNSIRESYEHARCKPTFLSTSVLLVSAIWFVNVIDFIIVTLFCHCHYLLTIGLWREDIYPHFIITYLSM